MMCSIARNGICLKNEHQSNEQAYGWANTQVILVTCIMLNGLIFIIKESLSKYEQVSSSQAEGNKS